MNSESVLVLLKDGVKTIKLNRPKLKNAFNTDVFETLTNILNADALNDEIVVIILTGTGTFFSSGLELTSNMPNIDAIENFTLALADYPKLLVAVVNGPAFGLAVTMLPLFDIVYASDRASFTTPFIQHGFAPEGSSTYFFPRIMGRSKAMEMLLLGEKLSVEDALNFNLISEIVSHENLDKLFKKLLTLSNFPVTAIKTCKNLINSPLKKHLHTVIRKEMDQVRKDFQSSDVYLKAVEKFKLKKGKL